MSEETAVHPEPPALAPPDRPSPDDRTRSNATAPTNLDEEAAEESGYGYGV